MSLDNGYIIINYFFSTRSHQDLHFVWVIFRCTDNLIVHIDFVERIGNVVIGLHFDLCLEVILAQTGGHLDRFGDYMGTSYGDGGVFAA